MTMFEEVGHVTLHSEVGILPFIVLVNYETLMPEFDEVKKYFSFDVV